MTLGNTITLGDAAGRKGSPVIIDPKQRGTHFYISGGTGSGKSRFLENMLRQDIMARGRSGCGLMLLDPHGSIYNSLMTWLAYVRPGASVPIVPLNFQQNQWVVGYNLLKDRPGRDRSVVVDEFVTAMLHVWGAQDASSTPRLERWSKNVLRVLLENGLTLVDAEILLDEMRKQIRKKLLANVSDASTVSDWMNLDLQKGLKFEEMLGSTANRLGPFLRNQLLRLTFGQGGETLDLEQALAEGWIILVNLSTEGGHFSNENARLMGTLLLSDLWRAAKHRGKDAQGSRKPFYLYVDEFQEFVTPTIARNLDQARGFGLHLTLANQFPKQFLAHGEAGRMLYDSVMENARSKAVFRLENPENADPLARWLFDGQLNLDERKLEMYATKVMGYEEVTRTSTSWSESSSTGESSGQVDSLCKPDAEEEDGYPDPSELELEHIQGRSVSQGASSSQGSNYSESTSMAIIPVLGQELSSVQFRSLEEHRHQGVARILSQAERFTMVKLPGMSQPMQVFSADVKDFHVRPERVSEYQETLWKRLGFAKPAVIARLEMLTRREELLLTAEHPLFSEEPATTRRKLATPKEEADIDCSDRKFA